MGGMCFWAVRGVCFCLGNLYFQTFCGCYSKKFKLETFGWSAIQSLSVKPICQCESPSNHFPELIPIWGLHDKQVSAEFWNRLKIVINVLSPFIDLQDYYEKHYERWHGLVWQPAARTLIEPFGGRAEELLWMIKLDSWILTLTKKNFNVWFYTTINLKAIPIAQIILWEWLLNALEKKLKKTI